MLNTALSPPEVPAFAWFVWTLVFCACASSEREVRYQSTVDDDDTIKYRTVERRDDDETDGEVDTSVRERVMLAMAVAQLSCPEEELWYSLNNEQAQRYYHVKGCGKEMAIAVGCATEDQCQAWAVPLNEIKGEP